MWDLTPTPWRLLACLCLCLGWLGGAAMAQIPSAAPGYPPPPPPPPPMMLAPPGMGGMGGMGMPAPMQPGARDPGSPTSQRLQALPTVSIKEFRSSVQEVTPRAATDMFMTALIRLRRFRVVERARLAEGIATEKAMNQQGQSTGEAGQARYTAATYWFEGTVSEATNGENQRGWGLGAMGAGVGQTQTSDTLAIDVRLLDVESGIALDAQTVRKKIATEEVKAGGLVNALLGSLLRGNAAQTAQNMAPIDQISQSRRDSVDKALREAIEEALAVIVGRLPAEGGL